MAFTESTCIRFGNPGHTHFALKFMYVHPINNHQICSNARPTPWKYLKWRTNVLNICAGFQLHSDQVHRSKMMSLPITVIELPLMWSHYTSAHEWAWSFWSWVGETESTWWRVQPLFLANQFQIPFDVHRGLFLACSVEMVRVNWNRYDTACCYILYHVIRYCTLFHIVFFI